MGEGRESNQLTYATQRHLMRELRREGLEKSFMFPRPKTASKLYTTQARLNRCRMGGSRIGYGSWSPSLHLDAFLNGSSKECRAWWQRLRPTSTFSDCPGDKQSPAPPHSNFPRQPRHREHPRTSLVSLSIGSAQSVSSRKFIPRRTDRCAGDALWYIQTSAPCMQALRPSNPTSIPFGWLSRWMPVTPFTRLEYHFPVYCQAYFRSMVGNMAAEQDSMHNSSLGMLRTREQIGTSPSPY